MVFDRRSDVLAEFEDIEIDTVDRYQGRDKDCVLITLVRSNADQQIGALLKDWRRANVAFTRAKKKLVIVGSVKTFSFFPLYSTLFELLTSKDWIYKMPQSY
eukprot:TRINITY_DN12064_c0_g1_i1.p1 TRINITY_DN12064_c0_g1~~TRINITY_DN12064_c0_g1_i1.p1  ORF type:complete len:102 (+),score=11.93 TRINITY_DN12064_c0_g1_i1:74-379(+)